MLDFYQQLAISLKQGAVVLATVISTNGSVPREVGAKMLITADGKTYGTIGGGAGEAKVYQTALQVLATGVKQFVEIDLSGAPHRQIQGVCGGTMQIWLELWSGDSSLNLVNQIIANFTSGKSAAIITPLYIDSQPYLTTADIPDLPQLTNHSFIEPLLPPPTLLIIGCGHIAVPLAKIAKIAGFKIIVQDDRPDFATPDRFPDAALVLAQPIQEIQEIIQHIPNLYITLVTRGYLQDIAALPILSQINAKYIGMVGSRKRVRTVYKSLDNQSKLAKIYAPIGLDIGALTPEEIAVSICAELIKVRRGGTGVSLSEQMD
ncbi:XdhC family protein [Anabaena sp. 4-3]|uniref:XdhC family protein n=1 Tax=Anabaena sp. 4-3 TaxID=1811979 RepID=UPI00082DF746|nr:XdhC/CoxI family protein [Anabaena sp. 4-3]